MVANGEEKIRVYRLPGPTLLHDEDVDRFQDEVRALINEADGLKLLVDCSATHHVGSRVLGLLVAFQQEITKRNGCMILFGATPAAQRVLDVTRLNTVLKVAATEAEARELVSGSTPSSRNDGS